MGLNTSPVKWPPFTFGRLFMARCRVSMYVLPLQSHAGPQPKAGMRCGKSCHPGEPPWGSHAPVMGAPIHFRLPCAARFLSSPCARAGPNAAAVEDEGVGLPGKLSRTQHAAILFPGPRHAAVAVSPGISQVVMLRRQAVGVELVQAAERPADLAPVHFNC
jgi:hypothetical protein